MKYITLSITLLFFTANFGQNTNESDSTTAKYGTKTTSELVIEADDNPTEANKPDENQVWSSAGIEFQPEYPGGWNKLMEDFNKKFRLKVDKDLKGRIFLEFIVEKDGTLSDIKIIRDLGFGSGKKAVRVIESLPKWNPGIHEGKILRVRYSFPLIIDMKANTDFNQYHPPVNNKNIQELKDKN